MSAAADLIALLNSSVAIVALGADKVYLNAADEGTVAPYIVVLATVEPIYGLDNTHFGDHVSFTAAAWGATADHAELVGDAIQSAIDAAPPLDGLLVTSRNSGIDQQTTMDVSVLTIDRWL